MRTLRGVGHADVAEFGMSLARTVHQRSAGKVTGRFSIGVKARVPWYHSERACTIERPGAAKADRLHC